MKRDNILILHSHRGFSVLCVAETENTLQIRISRHLLNKYYSTYFEMSLITLFMLLLPHLFETPKAHAYLENNLTRIDWRLFDLCRLTLIEPRSFCFTGGSPKCQTRAIKTNTAHAHTCYNLKSMLTIRYLRVVKLRCSLRKRHFVE